MSTILGNGEITVNGSSEYESRMSGLIKQILTTQTGHAIAVKIKAHGQVLILDSYTSAKSVEINSDYEPSRTSNNLAIISFSSNYVDIYTPVIRLNGEIITVRQFQAIRRRFSGQEPDEILVHELTHAARRLGGDAGKVQLKGTAQSAYENEEEFYAVLVANIYSSERGRSYESFRKSHDLSLKPEMGAEEAERDTFLFAEGNFDLIAKFCGQHPTIAPMIAEAKADFNPLRDYYNFKKGVAPALHLKATEDIPGKYQVTQHD